MGTPSYTYCRECFRCLMDVYAAARVHERCCSSPTSEATRGRTLSLLQTCLDAADDHARTCGSAQNTWGTAVGIHIEDE